MTWVTALMYFVFSVPVFCSALPDLSWTMVHLDENSQGDAHVIRLKNGDVYVVDTGPLGRSLLKFLRATGIRHLKAVVLSHFHKDHYGGIEGLITAGIHIDEIIVSIPTKSVCDSERPWGCDFKDIQNTLEFVKSHGVKVRKAQAGDVYFNSDGAKLEVVCVFNGENSPKGRTDVNDTSIIMKLIHGATTVLFTGDLNANLADYLTRQSVDLKADLLKVPHHGTEGLPANAFFDKVGAKVALVPSPKALWLSERSERTRNYFKNRGTEVYVEGMDGDVTVSFDSKGFTVASDHDKGQSP
jgi:competence protein ComEC